MSDFDPIVLIPGMLCDADLWRDQIEALRGEALCHVPMPGSATIDAMADEILAVAPARFALAGLSMGGYVALAMVGRAPHRVSRLLLANTSAGPDTAEQTAARYSSITRTEAGDFGLIVKRLLGILVHRRQSADAAMMERIEAMLHRVGPEAFVRQQKAAAGRPDARAGLGNIGVPTEVIGGDADLIIPPEHARELAQHIPQARLTMLAECGHLSPIEQPGPVTVILRRWITG